jgi:hypothetical protein
MTTRRRGGIRMAAHVASLARRRQSARVASASARTCAGPFGSSSSRSIHDAGSAFSPTSAPQRAPLIAAIVSVSPPASTAFAKEIRRRNASRADERLADRDHHLAVVRIAPWARTRMLERRTQSRGEPRVGRGHHLEGASERVAYDAPQKYPAKPRAQCGRGVSSGVVRIHADATVPLLSAFPCGHLALEP